VRWRSHARSLGKLQRKLRRKAKRRAARSSRRRKRRRPCPVRSSAVRGPCGRRLGCESSATRRQRHRPVDHAAQTCQQAARTFARGRPQYSSVGDHGQSRLSRCRKVKATPPTALGPSTCTGYKEGLRGKIRVETRGRANGAVRRARMRR